MRQPIGSRSQQQKGFSSSESEPLKRKRGRPPGSKTKNHPVVDLKPAACISCGKTNLQHLGTMNILDYGGFNDGQEYNQIVWYRKQCDGCGQVQVVKVFRMIAARTSQENT